jgi:hypothetical protein
MDGRHPLALGLEGELAHDRPGFDVEFAFEPGLRGDDQERPLGRVASTRQRSPSPLGGRSRALLQSCPTRRTGSRETTSSLVAARPSTTNDPSEV